MRALLVIVTVAVMGAVVGIGTAAPAHAQGYGPGTYAGPPPPPPRGVVRSGLIFGGGIGLGGFGLVDCEDCDGVGGGALQLHIGGMLGPNLALMFDGQAIIGPVGGDDSDIFVTSSTALLALRIWVAPILWIQGGLGAGWLEVSDVNSNFRATSDAGFAGMVAAGIEVLQSPYFTLDVQLRIAGSRFGNSDDDGSVGIGSVAVLLGFNWY